MKPEIVETHTHKPCLHRCRCISAKGGCPKCATLRQLKLAKERGW
jgi:hypothetical protein